MWIEFGLWIHEMGKSICKKKEECLRDSPINRQIDYSVA